MASRGSCQEEPSIQRVAELETELEIARQHIMELEGVLKNQRAEWVFRRKSASSQ